MATPEGMKSNVQAVLDEMEPQGHTALCHACSLDLAGMPYIRTMRICVDVEERLPKVTIKPAACHVVPDVSLSRSNSNTSSTPRFAKWYATLVPIIPPPVCS
jgi:hypothetical protein